MIMIHKQKPKKNFKERKKEKNMKPFNILLILVTLIITNNNFIQIQAQENNNNNGVPTKLNDDVLGLIVFKSNVIDPLSLLRSWNEDDESPCSWSYIQCNPNTGRVASLSLDTLGLSGKLGIKGLQKLPNLLHLSLSHNNFSGNISPEFAFLASLVSLNLSHNSFHGQIPDSLATLFNTIKFIDLSNNQLSGTVSATLFQPCMSLRYFSVAENSLEGSIPSSLSQCASLSTLNLSNNRFSGDPGLVSWQLWSLTRLRALDLSGNMLSGSLQQGISSIHNLKELKLEKNRLSGPLPLDIGLCPHLYKLDLSDNLFTGELPESLQRLNSLSFFSISNNMVSGPVPNWIGKMYNLEYIDFSNNGLNGNLPSSIGDLRSLSYLRLSNNKLTGEIPTNLMYCSQLSVIKLNNNAFNGSVPEKLFELGLQEVDFSSNELVGAIPSGSSKLFESLSVLDLSNNKLKGDIPAELGLFSKLQYLNLSRNDLTSRLPPEIGYIRNLTVLDLRKCALYGAIPVDLCDSGSLSILQLDGNQLSGSIPGEIGNCSSLYLLSLSQNNLTGAIPKSISKLNSLKILKLENNGLEGEIPQELGKLENLLAVNVSYNRLIGRLPDGGIFNSLDESSLQGNIGICSPLLKGPCKMNAPKPLVINPHAYGNQMGGRRGGDADDENSQDAGFDGKHHKFLSVSAIVAISASALIMFGVIVISLVNLSARKRLALVNNIVGSMHSGSSCSANINGTTGKLILFDYKSTQELESIVNPETLLSKAFEIGGGVFGTVYKYSLGVEGRFVAIKKLVSSNIIQYQEDFDREIRILGKARHPNLIGLKGYYWTPELQLLVMDFAPGGNLQEILHENPPSVPSLSWEIRFKIILGTAKGLAHLHHGSRPSIIHYSLKPSNILLDENYNPKISDYGLARLLTKLDKHVISNRFQSNLGYVAPELACQSLRVNEKCDIYAFGVLILELVTGKKPVEYEDDNMVILSDHVRVLLEQGNVLECVDLGMGGYPEEEVLPVLKLALVCTSQIPSSRPSMAEVVQILQVIKTPIPMF